VTDSSISSTSRSTPDQVGAASAQAQRRSALVTVMFTNALLSLGFQLWRSLFNNFAVADLGVRADQMGLIQSIREVPGLLGFGVAFLALLLSEMRLAAWSVVLMGIGVAMTGRAVGMSGLLISTLVMSVGLHVFMPCTSSAVLMLVGKDEAPRVLGRLNSLGALAALVGAAIVILGLDVLGFRVLFYATGALLILGGLAVLPWSRKPIQPPGEPSSELLARTPTRGRISLRRRYWLYHALQLLMGSRRHMFTTFAVFLLVQQHGVSAQAITVLFLINSVIGTFLFQRFGKLIARFGERRVLTVDFLLLIIVFLGYAFIPLLPVLYVLFVIDQILFGFSIALQSYLQKIALRPQDLMPTVSMGQTMNHVAAVGIPLVGGVVWETVGSRYTFLIGVGIAVLSLVLVQWMRTETEGTPRTAAVKP